MSDGTGSVAPRGRVLTYLAVAVVVLALVIAGVVRYRVREVTAPAREKAATLAAAFDAAGLPHSRERVLARVFGVDGGAVCADPGAALSRAAADAALTNGAAHVGLRPIRAARSLVVAETIVLRVYCPEQLPRFEEYVRRLRLEGN